MKILLYTVKMLANKRIIVGMSGGVDSTLSALLLRRNYDVVGVTLKLHNSLSADDNNASCGNAKSLERAQRAADEIDIPLIIIDCSKSFHDQTLTQCWDLLKNGCTPNPCHICNANVKFRELLKAAESLNADLIATGHYAQIYTDSSGRKVLKRGADYDKDQSYFLSGLTPEILARTVFPLGAMKKSAVKQIAAEYGLSSVHLRESQDLCFAVNSSSFAETLFTKFNGKAITGSFMDEQGHILAPHNGIHQYTIGQRRGLGFATGKRVKITDINIETGNITVSHSNAAACSDNCKARSFIWHSQPLVPGTRVEAQVRYRQKAVTAMIVDSTATTVELTFDTPVFGVTPGQILVLYIDDCVQGCGVITR